MRELLKALWLFVGIVVCWNQAQGNPINHGDAILVHLPGATISRIEFEVNLQAWRDRYPSSQQHSSQYLNLLIRLKQLALIAANRGMHQTPEFKLRLARFIAEAHKTGLLQRDIENWKLREAYDRQQYVLNASHILKIAQAAGDTEPVSALHKIQRFRERLLANETTFGNLARRESDDPSAMENSGRLGFFTVFDQLYPLETAAYETPVGLISDPVMSRFGYHLIKVTNRIRIKGLRQASHILVKNMTSDNARQSTDARAKIERIHGLLTAHNFAAIASAHSQDYKTSIVGGDLGTDRLIDALERLKLTLPVGAFSAPFQSSMGWHILKVTGIQSFPSFTQMRPLLRQKLKLDARVARNVDLIIGAIDPTAIESVVVDAYIEDSLCKMILSQSGAIPIAESETRIDLIKRLLDRELPRDLIPQTMQYRSIIDNEVFQSIGR